MKNNSRNMEAQNLPGVANGAYFCKSPHVCQLNQSPWDVMSFSPPSTPPPLPPPPQVDRDDVSAGNGSSNQSISVVQREFEIGRHREYSGRVAATDKAKQPESEGVIILCSKTDGKSWQCKREAPKGNSLCEHHLSLMKNYTNNLAHSTIKKPEKPVVFRPRPKRASTSSSSNPHEFYYYSGFGPRWGKKRGEKFKNNGPGTPKNLEHEHALDPLILGIIDEDFNYAEDEDDDEENRENAKKRARKPIKARSLKSLM